LTAAARDDQAPMQTGGERMVLAEPKDGTKKTTEEKFGVDGNPQLKGRLTMGISADFECGDRMN
jgi:hypothetical protein